MQILRRYDKANERVFIDNNGFRHYWSAFENLRKSNITPRENNTELKTGVNNIDGAVLTTKSISKSKKIKKRKLLRDSKEKKVLTNKKVVATTTFFCPFFGIMKLRTPFEQ